MRPIRNYTAIFAAGITSFNMLLINSQCLGSSEPEEFYETLALHHAEYESKISDLDNEYKRTIDLIAALTALLEDTESKREHQRAQYETALSDLHEVHQAELGMKDAELEITTQHFESTLTEKSAQHHAEIAELEQRADRILAEKDERLNQVQQKLSEELVSKEREIQQLKTDILAADQSERVETLNKQKNALQQELEEIKSAHSDLHAAHEDLHASMHQREKSALEAKQQLALALNDLVMAIDLAEALKEEQEDLSFAVADHEAKANLLNMLARELKAENRAIQKDNEQLIGQNFAAAYYIDKHGELSEQIALHEQEKHVFASRHEKYAMIESENEALKKDLAAAHESLDQERLSLSQELAKQKEALLSQHQTTVESLAHANQTIENLQSRLAKAELAISVLEQQKEQLLLATVEEIGSLEQKNSELAGALANASAEFALAQREIGELRIRRASRDNEVLASLQLTLKSAEEENLALIAENVRLTDHIAHLANEYIVSNDRNIGAPNERSAVAFSLGTRTPTQREDTTISLPDQNHLMR